MKKTSIIGIVMLLGIVAGLQAQDTIDTNYYRYDNHFIYNDLWSNTYIDGYIHVCPNGLGFYNHFSWRFDSRSYNTIEDNIAGNQNFFMNDYARHDGFLTHMNFCNINHICYKLGSKRQKVYGIAFAIDSIFNLTEGDSMTAILCTRSEDHTHFIDLDSITIKGGEMGKRRWMELPMLKSEVYENEFDETSQPFETCIDTVRYLQVLEFYFDGRSYTIDDYYVFWKLRVADGNGSVFCGTRVSHPLSSMFFAEIWDREIDWKVGYEGWDFLFPIVEPLPDWEEPTITQVVPDAQKPDNPDQQDPENPQDPEDPNNPGGDEGIGQTIGGQQSSVTIYPNPASNSAVVTCAQPILELTLRDINGRLILTQRNCGTSTTLDTSTLSPGLYILQVTTPAATTTRKLAVK